MTRPLWTAAEAAEATQGTLEGPDWSAQGVSIDSRDVAPGDLFIALVGPIHDGHDHVVEALERGAAAVMIHHRIDGLPKDAPLLVVGDSMEGLTALAAAARARSKAKIIAVTGSVGKTGTKEMLKLALETAGPTHATLGNLNNHWGVPLSLTRMPADTRFAVFELGMNHPGEIEPLSRLVRPHIVIITAVEAVHMEFFASTAAIAEAKGEIFAGLEPGGHAILPHDNPHYPRLVEIAQAEGVTAIDSFGCQNGATARLLDFGLDPTSTLVFALLANRSISYRIGIPGRQWAINSLAVLLAVRAAGLSIHAPAQALASIRGPKGRGARIRLAWDQAGLEIIDETYNASPISMEAAIATLAAARTGPGGRRIAVLGDMLELGEGAPEMHAGLAASLVAKRIDLVFTAGPLMRHLSDALPPERRGGHAADADALVTLLAPVLKGGDVIMVKGSAGSRMGRIIEKLSAIAAPAASDGL